LRAVLDPNVIVSALLAPSGTPAKVLRAWLDGDYELIASPLLIAELTRVFDYPKLRSRISETESRQFIELLKHQGEIVETLTCHSPSIRRILTTTTSSCWRRRHDPSSSPAITIFLILPIAYRHSPAEFWKLLNADL